MESRFLFTNLEKWKKKCLIPKCLESDRFLKTEITSWSYFVHTNLHRVAYSFLRILKYTQTAFEGGFPDVCTLFISWLYVPK